MRRLRSGFTLIEILLAMLMMGIIAVSILPGITKNAEQQLFITQLKKVQNELQQAMLIISSKNKNNLANVFNNNDYKRRWDIADNGFADQNSLIFAYAIRTALEAHCIYYAGTQKNPTNNRVTDPQTQAQLFANRNPHYMDTAKTQLYAQVKDANNNWGQPANFVAMNLKDGATIRPIIINANCAIGAVCGALEVDLNGIKRPNMVGKDIHFFWVVNSDDGVVPWGENPIYDAAPNIRTVTGQNNANCILNNNGKFNSPGDTLGCTYRALQDGRITYY